MSETQVIECEHDFVEDKYSGWFRCSKCKLDVPPWYFDPEIDFGDTGPDGDEPEDEFYEKWGPR